jgi:hypothetical protein
VYYLFPPSLPRCEFKFEKEWMGPVYSQECLNANRFKQNIQKVCQCAQKQGAQQAGEFCEEAQKDEYFPATMFQLNNNRN